MKKSDQVKVNYNIYAEEKEGRYQSIIVRIIKKGLMERKDSFLYITKEARSLDHVYLNVINEFIQKNAAEINENITGLNVITPISSGLVLLKSKYKKIDPYIAKDLIGIEDDYLKARNFFQKKREEGIQVQYVVIDENERNREIGEIAYRLNNEKYLFDHFFAVTTKKKTEKLLQKNDPIILKDDNHILNLYISLETLKDNNHIHQFCCTAVKTNKYGQPKNHYYTLKINSENKEVALLESIAKFYTENKHAMKLLNSCNLLNIHHDGEYIDRIQSLFSNVMNNETEINKIDFIPENVKSAMNNYVKKNNYRLDKVGQKKSIKYEELKNNKNTMIIYTDGSVKNKSELSCFGAVFRMPDSDYIIYELSGNSEDISLKNNIDMIENKGIISALNFINEKIKNKDLKNNFNIEIRCDSFNNINAINNCISGKLNSENKLWVEKINDIVQISKEMGVKIDFNWVKGHHEDPYNIRADKLAKIGYMAPANEIYINHQDLELEKILKNKNKPEITKKRRIMN